MTEFISRVCHGESRYEVIIKTDNEGDCKAAEEFARSLIGHKKPQTNADRIRAMSDRELAEFLYGFAYGVEALGACWDCQGEALEWLREPTGQDEDEEQDEEDDKRLQRLGRWVFWDGWVSNHDLRIDEAFCSACGYRHPSVRWEEGDPTGAEAAAAVLDKLVKECPRCGAKMIGGGDGEK